MNAFKFQTFQGADSLIIQEAGIKTKKQSVLLEKRKKSGQLNNRNFRQNAHPTWISYETKSPVYI
jgi:hypothetical protein